MLSLFFLPHRWEADMLFSDQCTMLLDEGSNWSGTRCFLQPGVEESLRNSIQWHPSTSTIWIWVHSSLCFLQLTACRNEAANSREKNCLLSCLSFYCFQLLLLLQACHLCPLGSLLLFTISGLPYMFPKGWLKRTLRSLSLVFTPRVRFVYYKGLTKETYDICD